MYPVDRLWTWNVVVSSVSVCSVCRPRCCRPVSLCLVFLRCAVVSCHYVPSSSCNPTNLRSTRTPRPDSDSCMYVLNTSLALTVYAIISIAMHTYVYTHANVITLGIRHKTPQVCPFMMERGRTERENRVSIRQRTHHDICMRTQPRMYIRPSATSRYMHSSRPRRNVQ